MSVNDTEVEFLKMESEIARLKGHLPDCCINETCGQSENSVTGDVVANVMNTAKGISKLTEDEYIELSDMIGDRHREAMHAAVRERDAKIAELQKRHDDLWEMDRKIIADLKERLEKECADWKKAYTAMCAEYDKDKIEWEALWKSRLNRQSEINKQLREELKAAALPEREKKCES